MRYCKHSLPIEQCSYCNGDYSRKEQEIQKHKLERAQRREYKIKWRTLQADSLSRAVNYRKELDVTTLKTILASIDGYTKQDVDVLYDVAIKTGRSLGGICWIWNYAYGDYEKLNIKDGEEREVYLKVQAIKEVLGL